MTPEPDYEALKNTEISVVGEGIPPHVNNFDECHLNQKLLYTLTNILKYKEPTPVQKYGIPLIMAGHNAIIYSHTGSGKTATYLLPIIDNILKKEIPVAGGMPVALILSPTRELAIQVRTHLVELSWQFLATYALEFL